MTAESNPLPGTPRKKRVILAITKSSWGGAQRYVYDIATMLDPNLYDVSVICGGIGTLSERLREKNIPVQSLQTLGRDISAGKDARAFWNLVSYLRREQPDILHLNSSKMGIVGVIAGKIAGVPRIIFTAHGWAFTEERGWLQKKIFFALQALTVLLADETIAVSEETKEFMRGLPFIVRKITVIRNGIDAGRDHEHTKESARAYLARHLASNQLFEKAVNQKGRWIGTISELHNNKGLTYLIGAIAELRTRFPDKHLLCVIIGGGEEEQKIQRLIEDKKLESTVFLTGYLPLAASLLPAFDIFTLTSITEGLPYVLLEAGAIGLPTIASDVGGIPEIITDMESGLLLQPRKVSEIRDALSFYLEKPDKAEAFGASLKRRISETFSLEKMTRETTALYEKK